MTSPLVTTSTKRNPRSSIAGTAIWGGLSAVVISIASFCWVLWQSNCAIAVLSLFPLHLVSLGIVFHSIRTSLQIDFDYLTPRTVALITFLLLWILSMPFVALNPTALAYISIIGEHNSDDIQRAILAQVAVLTGMLAMLTGIHAFDHIIIISWRQPTISSLNFLLVGIVCLLAGIAGNVEICGGISEYAAKIPRFYERSERYELFIKEGGFLVTQFIRSLPMALLVLAWGTALWFRASTTWCVVLLLSGSVANILLSSATGGRGIGLTTAFYSLIVLNAKIRRIRIPSALILIATVIFLALGLGIARGASRIETELSSSIISDRITQEKLQTFWLGYLTNDLRLLQVVDAVTERGFAWGLTIIDPLKSLIQARPPITTGIVLSEFDTVVRQSSASRFGTLADAYFNFGYFGVAIAMFCIGSIVGILNRIYRCGRYEDSVSGMIAVCWSSFTANYIVGANFHGLPKYFFLASVPIIAMWLVLRGRRC